MMGPVVLKVPGATYSIRNSAAGAAGSIYNAGLHYTQLAG
jgi:hypothetical protein